MNRMILALVCPALVVASLAQSSHNSASHVSTPADIIDGAKTPDVIPDVTAWRLWMLAASASDQNHPDKSTDRRRSFLQAAGILPDDLIVADNVLVQFRSDYETLVSRYNHQLEQGQSPSFAQFAAERNSLVEASRSSMLGSLAPRSSTQLRNFVRGEKARMRVAKGEIQ